MIDAEDFVQVCQVERQWLRIPGNPHPAPPEIQLHRSPSNRSSLTALSAAAVSSFKGDENSWRLYPSAGQPCSSSPWSRIILMLCSEHSLLASAGGVMPLGHPG